MGLLRRKERHARVAGFGRLFTLQEERLCRLGAAFAATNKWEMEKGWRQDGQHLAYTWLRQLLLICCTCHPLPTSLAHSRSLGVKFDTSMVLMMQRPVHFSNLKCRTVLTGCLSFRNWNRNLHRRF